MTKELRVGFVGCGQHATLNLYPALDYAPVRLVSVCDLSAGRMEYIRKRYHTEAGFSTVEELLRGPELDALIVCGPPELHHSAAIMALDAGLHVFTEKPPAPDLRGALEVQAAAQRNHRWCMTGFMKRFALRYKQAKAISESKGFGNLSHLLIKYTHWNMPNLHDMLIYMSVHPLDLIRFFAGPLARINIERAERHGQFTFSINAVAKSGTLVTLVANAQEPRVKEHVELTGEGELVVVRNVIELEYHRKVRPSKMFMNELDDATVVRPDMAIPNPNQNSLFLQGYAGEMMEFANALLEKRPPSVTIDDGVAAMRLADILETCPPSCTLDTADWD